MRLRYFYIFQVVGEMLDHFECICNRNTASKNEKERLKLFVRKCFIIRRHLLFRRAILKLFDRSGEFPLHQVQIVVQSAISFVIYMTFYYRSITFVEFRLMVSERRNASYLLNGISIWGDSRTEKEHLTATKHNNMPDAFILTIIWEELAFLEYSLWILYSPLSRIFVWAYLIYLFIILSNEFLIQFATIGLGTNSNTFHNQPP